MFSLITLNPLVAIMPADVDECWICSLNGRESDENLVSLGCKCRRVCHVSCAKKWYGHKSVCETCLSDMRGDALREETAIVQVEPPTEGEETPKCCVKTYMTIYVVLFVVLFVGIFIATKK